MRDTTQWSRAADIRRPPTARWHSSQPGYGRNCWPTCWVLYCCRPWMPREAMRRHQCAERMHRITLAMLRYESDHGTLPPAYTVDADGIRCTRGGCCCCPIWANKRYTTRSGSTNLGTANTTEDSRRSGRLLPMPQCGIVLRVRQLTPLSSAPKCRLRRRWQITRRLRAEKLRNDSRRRAHETRLLDGSDSKCSTSGRRYRN